MSSNYNEQDDQSQYGGYRGYTANQQKQQGRRPYSFSGNDSENTGTGASARDYGYGTGSYSSASGGQQQQQQQQQYASGTGTYQAPRSASRSRMTTPTDSTSFGMSARLEAALSYLLWWVTGLFFFIFERKNKYVRYHAAQSILFLGAAAIIFGILKFIAAFAGSIFLIGFVLGPLFGLLVWVVGVIFGLTWLYLMFQAFRGKRVRMPYVSGLAERLSR